MKIIFHDNSLCVRGTTVALYDYAFYCKHMFGVDSVIMYDSNHLANDQKTIEKFKNEFSEVYSYSSRIDMQNKISDLKADAFFMIKHGKNDGVLSNSCENWINAIGPCSRSDIHGDKFYMGSKWLTDVSQGIDYVPYMVNLPDIQEDMREELGIPKDAIVFGRNGGNDAFNIPFAKQAVIDSLSKKDNIYFLFQGTDVFIEHPRVIHLPPSPDLNEKVRFINTTDALLHARDLGESFGQTCAEFSSKNKPVITWFGSPERNHIMVLGDKGIYYNDYSDLLKIILEFVPDNSKDWNCYREYLPSTVMEKFKKYYLDK
jgi:hypothetical protein